MKTNTNTSDTINFEIPSIENEAQMRNKINTSEIRNEFQMKTKTNTYSSKIRTKTKFQIWSKTANHKLLEIETPQAPKIHSRDIKHSNSTTILSRS